MNRFQSDQWSLGQGLTPSITSSFTLSLEKGHSKEISKGIIYSAKCGLGWRFTVAATNADTELGDKSSGNVIITLQKTQFEFSFDPHIINNTDLKNLTISTTVERMTPLLSDYNPSKAISLPTPKWPRMSLGRFNSEENYTGRVTVTFQVDLPTTFNLSLPVGLPPSRIRQVLGDSLMGHDLIDTEFILFTRRTRKHQPAKPRAIFGNSHLLRGFSSYLDILLDGNGYKESTEVDLGSNSFDDIPIDDYSYLSDSDLDSDDEDEKTSPVTTPAQTPSPIPTPIQTPLDPAPMPSQTPPPDLAPPRTPPSERTNLRPDKEPSNNTHLESGKNSATSWAPPHVGKAGRRIVVNDTAFKTWKSFMFYLYTGKLEFRPLGQSRWKEVHSASPGIPKCSPKSMFRLADKIDLPELQRLALDAIRRSLTKENILDELFSTFTSMYPKVQEIEIEFLTANLTADLFQQFKKKLKLVVAGDYPHSFDILSDLIEKMCNGGVHILPSPKGKMKKGRVLRPPQ
ncbi:hypothetical protein BDZ94DRAFT_1248999 [Collybia nuda]|uniref:BTB/POZ domain-containing protein n=1 Tax=Collybia nuda TaxID=64659 RepID=A0A9P6CNT0_9AGAR|nr:hypothetical protein BDZ94DRAFT_1248999 [Collybia nuda]